MFAGEKKNLENAFKWKKKTKSQCLTYSRFFCAKLLTTSFMQSKEYSYRILIEIR